MFLKLNIIGLLVIGLSLTSCLKAQKGNGLEKGSALGVADATVTESMNGNVKRKRADLLRNSLAKILVLHPQGMCLELGRLPCADLVHKVSLGGMNAYGNAQYRYPEHVSVSSSMSLDRLVMSACIQRAQMDLINPAQAVLFKNIELSVDGRLVKSEAVSQSIQTLYQRAFLRDATAHELESIVQLYESIYAEQPIGAARNWMVLSCYAVLTTVEAAFY